jgi:hypothetical protein
VHAPLGIACHAHWREGNSRGEGRVLGWRRQPWERMGVAEGRRRS